MFLCTCRIFYNEYVYIIVKRKRFKRANLESSGSPGISLLLRGVSVEGAPGRGNVDGLFLETLCWDSDRMPPLSVGYPLEWEN